MATLCRIGDSGDAVFELQSRLEEAGFSCSADPPGKFGPATEQALRAFQRSRNLRVDGVCGPQSWSALIEAGFRLGDRLIYLTRPMQRGEDVAQLQRLLGSLGFDTGRVDGIFGPETEAALVQFQRNSGLVADGICGSATCAELARLASRGGGPSLMAEIKERESLRSSPRTLAGRRTSISWESSLARVASLLASRLREAGALVVEIEEPDPSQQASRANAEAVDVHLFLEAGSGACLRCAAYYAGYSYESAGGKRLAELLIRHLASLGPPTRLRWNETAISADPDEVHRLAHSDEIHGMSLPILRETRMTAVVLTIAREAVEAVGEAMVAQAVGAAFTDWASQEWD